MVVVLVGGLNFPNFDAHRLLCRPSVPTSILKRMTVLLDGLHHDFFVALQLLISIWRQPTNLLHPPARLTVALQLLRSILKCMTIPLDGLQHDFSVALQLLRSIHKRTTILLDNLQQDFSVALQLFTSKLKRMTILHDNRQHDISVSLQLLTSMPKCITSPASRPTYQTASSPQACRRSAGCIRAVVGHRDLCLDPILARRGPQRQGLQV
jgi:hypothetical protein